MFAYKRNEAKLDLFRMCFACSFEKISYSFSLVLASLQLSYFRFEAKQREILFFALKMNFVHTFFADYNRIDYNRMDSFTLIHIFKPIHTHIDTPVQAYIYRLIQSYIDTHF